MSACVVGPAIVVVVIVVVIATAKLCIEFIQVRGNKIIKLYRCVEFKLKSL